MSRRPVPARTALLAAALLPAVAAAPSAAHAQEIRGMTVSTPTAGREWGTEMMAATLEKLAAHGVNWVAIHPYGGLRNDGTVGRSGIDRMYLDPSWLTGAIDHAHRLGLSIFVKPHLAYWGTRFSWRGEITFDTEEDWERFFATYREWITRVADLSAGADGFAVGTELDLTVGHEEEWRGIIAAVREETRAPLTYSAGWDRYGSVPFWDALDAIGVQGYFPLVEHEGIPSRTELRAAWDGIVARLEEYSEAQGKVVVLGELGYNRSLEAAIRPWAYAQSADPRAEELQVLCLDVALEALAGSEHVVGAFLWKWFPGELSRGNFLMSTPAMRGVIAHRWGDAAARD
jgi:hypothetical protein